MSTELIELEKKKHTAIITLNRPDRHNALNLELILALKQAVENLQDDATVRSVILNAHGKNFCAGADLHWMKNSINFTEEDNINDAKPLAQLLSLLYHFSKPIICLVQGATYGGGVGLVAASDIVLATSNASFCFSEVKLGLIPAVISPYCVAAIGSRAARRYFTTAEIFSATKAHELSLVHEIVPENTLAARAHDIASLINKNAPTAVSASKQLILDVQAKTIDKPLIDFTTRAIAKTRTSSEAQAGIHAFFAKTCPPWQ